MDKLLEKLTAKKKRLDSFRPLSPELLVNIEEWLDIEYTYTSNWIEGNTLNRNETSMILGEGITIAGKTLREHLEATNHAKAISFIKKMMDKSYQYISEEDIKEIHKLILTGIDDKWAGIYRQIQVFVKGATLEPPSPAEIPYKMRKLIEWLNGIQDIHPVKVAADLHFRFVEIHPFIDGNGRTGRLLMNLILLQNGYPLAIIKTSERENYINAIDKGTVAKDLGDFYQVIFNAVDRSLNAYLSAVKGKSIIPFFTDKKDALGGKLLQIGQIAKETGVSIPTIRFYVASCLIRWTKKSPGGFMLFDNKTIVDIQKIKKLQKEKRLTLKEIKDVIRNKP